MNDDDVEQLLAENTALKAQLAEARTALRDLADCCVVGMRNGEPELCVHHEPWVCAMDLLAKPAPRADLFAAGMALAEAYHCHDKGIASEACLRTARDAYRSAKQAAK